LKAAAQILFCLMQDRPRGRRVRRQNSAPRRILEFVFLQVVAASVQVLHRNNVQGGCKRLSAAGTPRRRASSVSPSAGRRRSCAFKPLGTSSSTPIVAWPPGPPRRPLFLRSRLRAERRREPFHSCAALEGCEAAQRIQNSLFAKSSSLTSKLCIPMPLEPGRRRLRRPVKPARAGRTRHHAARR
jgi:hypothetical protein